MTDASQAPGQADRDHLLRANVTGRNPVFVGGEGVWLIDDLGRGYLDAASGVGVACLGYDAVDVARAVFDQGITLPYLHGLRFESPVTRQLANLVTEHAPADLEYAFFVSGGSEANESAFKFVRQYWLERGLPAKWQIIGRRPSFHGSTLATLAAGWHAGRRQRHAPLLLPFAHIETPNQYRGCAHCKTTGGGCTLACADELEDKIIELGPETVGSFIAEPVVGAAGGALVPPDGYFPRIREICTKYDVLFIADEVITGFGRLGTWFGVERFGIVPDIIVFGKGISAGYAPLAGMLVTRALVEVFANGSGRFEHNFTMAGHPMACAAGLAAVTQIEAQGLVDRVAGIEESFFARLRASLNDIAIVGDIRGLGLLAGVELVSDRQTKRPFPPARAVSARAAQASFEEGVLVYACQGGIDGGDSGDYILLMPPFVTTSEELAEMIERFARGIRRLSPDLGLT